MPKRILLADDSITIQKVVELTFSDGDYEIITANNGARALQKLAENTPDVILSDIIMPEKNGYEVCEYVKSHPEYRNIPVILLTGTFEPFDPDRAEKAGCDAVVTKPFESQALISKVEELIARRRRADEERRGRSGMQPLEAAPGPAAAVMSSAPEPEPAGEWQIPTFTPFTADPEPLGMGAPPEFSPDDAPFGSGGWSEAPVAAAASEEPFGSFEEVPAASDEAAFPPNSELETPPTAESSAAEPEPSAADHEAETKAFPLISSGFETASDFQGDVPEPAADEATSDEPGEPAAVFAAAEEPQPEDQVARTLQFPSAQPTWEAAPAAGDEQEPMPPERFDEGWSPQQETERDEPSPAEPGPMPQFDDFQPAEEVPEDLEVTAGDDADTANLFSASPLAASAAEVFTADEDESDDYVGRPDEPAYELSSGFPASEHEEQPEDRSLGAWDEPAERERGPFALPPSPEMWDAGTAGTEVPEDDVSSVPSEAAMAAAPLSDADIDRIARRVVELMSDQLVRNIAWEVIPDVAQAVVRERVRELEQA